MTKLWSLITSPMPAFPLQPNSVIVNSLGNSHPSHERNWIIVVDSIFLVITFSCHTLFYLVISFQENKYFLLCAKKSELFHLQIRSPNDNNNQGGLRWTQEQGTIWVSHVGGRDARAWTITCCLQCSIAGSWIRSGGARAWIVPWYGCRQPTWHFTQGLTLPLSLLLNVSV